MRISFIAVLQMANLFFGGMLAGVEFALHYGLGNAPSALTDRAQLQLRKAMTLRLRILVPALFLPTLLTSIALVALDRASPVFLVRISGLLALLLWVAIRVVGTIPTNSALVDWPVEAPPADWKAQIQHVERFHIVGTWASIVSFVCFLVTSR